MVFILREDEIVGSFETGKECCIVYYDNRNDIGVVEFRDTKHRSIGFPITRKEELVVFETMLKKLRMKIQDTFDEKEYAEWKKQTFDETTE